MSHTGSYVTPPPTNETSWVKTLQQVVKKKISSQNNKIEPKIGTAQLSNTASLEVAAVQFIVTAPGGFFCH